MNNFKVCIFTPNRNMAEDLIKIEYPYYSKLIKNRNALLAMFDNGDSVEWINSPIKLRGHRYDIVYYHDGNKFCCASYPSFMSLLNKKEIKVKFKDIVKKYELKSDISLGLRQPVIIRLDGVGFSNFTKNFEKPFDDTFSVMMQETMLYLCKNIQNCVFGYTQSDEISLVLCDYKNPETEAWFKNRLQKMVSVAAAMATVYFNKRLLFYGNESPNGAGIAKAWDDAPFFDARAFNISIEDVNNYFILRQKDAINNSILSLGQSFFSQKELNKLSKEKVKEKILNEKGFDWNSLSIKFQRGSSAIKIVEQDPDIDIKDGLFLKARWIIDNEIPLFNEIPNYIENEINFDKQEEE